MDVAPWSLKWMGDYVWAGVGIEPQHGAKNQMQCSIANMIMIGADLSNAKCFNQTRAPNMLINATETESH